MVPDHYDLSIMTNLFNHLPVHSHLLVLFTSPATSPPTKPWMVILIDSNHGHMDVIFLIMIAMRTDLELCVPDACPVDRLLNDNDHIYNIHNYQLSSYYNQSLFLIPSKTSKDLVPDDLLLLLLVLPPLLLAAISIMEQLNSSSVSTGSSWNTQMAMMQKLRTMTMVKRNLIGGRVLRNIRNRETLTISKVFRLGATIKHVITHTADVAVCDILYFGLTIIIQCTHIRTYYMWSWCSHLYVHQ